MPEKEVDRREEILSEQLGRYLLEIRHISHGTDAIPHAIKLAMDEYMKERCLEFIQWMLDKGVFATRVVDGEALLYYRGEYITKEQLFETFL